MYTSSDRLVLALLAGQVHVAWNSPLAWLQTVAAAGPQRARTPAMRDTACLNADVFDALVLLAAGSYAPEDIGRGWDAVRGLVDEMDHGRRVRLLRLGFPPDEAQALSALHTRNFM